MTDTTVLLQQVINGISLGAMYSLLAIGFTLVYGIMELINFAHFNVFMVGSFLGMWALELLGLSGQSQVLTGFALFGALAFAFVLAMLGCGRARRRHRAHRVAAAARRSRHHRHDHDDRGVLYPLQRHPVGRRRRREELPEPDAGHPLAPRRCRRRSARGADLGDLPGADAGLAACSSAAPGSARRCGRPRRTPRQRA